MGLLIRAGRSEWVPVFTGLSARQFRTPVRIVVDRGGQHVGVGRPWGLSLADRVLLTAVYYRTNLTFRQLGLGLVVDNFGWGHGWPFVSVASR